MDGDSRDDFAQGRHRLGGRWSDSAEARAAAMTEPKSSCFLVSCSSATIAGTAGAASRPSDASCPSARSRTAGSFSASVSSASVNGMPGPRASAASRAARRTPASLSARAAATETRAAPRCRRTVSDHCVVRYLFRTRPLGPGVGNLPRHRWWRSRKLVSVYFVLNNSYTTTYSDHDFRNHPRSGCP